MKVFTNPINISEVSMPHATLCVSGPNVGGQLVGVSAVSMPHAALCVSGQPRPHMALPISPFQCRTQHCVCRDKKLVRIFLLTKFQCRTQHCVCRDIKFLGSVRLSGTFQCRTQHCVCRDAAAAFAMLLALVVFQCRTQHCVCRDNIASASSISLHNVSMPHAALCVSGHRR